MDLFEYQARDIFEKHGVPVLAASVATTADEAEKAATAIGGKVVVKAQVKVGGRGKAGGVKLAENPQDAREKAGAILGMDIKGHTVRTVMIAAAAPIESEYYLAILLDRSNRTFLVMASVSGGMDIEEVAHTAPEKLAKIPVSAVDGISLAKAKEIVAAAQFPADVADQVADVLLKLWDVFQSEDATLVEVNPLVKTKDGKVIALDGKVTLDDNADFRQPDHEALVDQAAENPADAREKAGAILGMDIKGHVVRTVMIAAAAPIESEYYLAILLDRSNRTFLVMASVSGGMDIEEVAHTAPEKLAKIPVSAVDGISAAKAKEIVSAANFPADVADQVANVLVKLWEVFQSEDATLVEVNPLVKTNDGKVIALDGKVTLDDNAEFRQPDHGALIDQAAENPLEAAAKEKGLNYVKLEGEVGIIGNGAGLVMSTLDVVAYAGEKHGGVRPANFLDIGGGASAQVMADGLSIILGDKDVKSVFVNVFGGITACDAVATGIVQALELLGSKATKPIVVRLDGNNVMEGRAILNKAAHPLVQQLDTMDGAADRAAELAAK